MCTAFSVTLMNDAQDAAFRAIEAQDWSKASDHFARVASIASALKRTAFADSAARMAHKTAVIAECKTLEWRPIPPLPPLRVNVTA